MFEMMMSPLNILSSSALSNSSSANSTESTNRSPECSKSPPSPALPPVNSMTNSVSNSVSGKDSAVNAASLLHAFAGNPAMSSTLAQMFPGFPLHVAAAAAAAFYGQHPQQNPYSALYGSAAAAAAAQSQQQQQLTSLLAAARQMTPNAFMAMQTGKKLSDHEPSFCSKLSPNQHQMPPPASQQTPTSAPTPQLMYGHSPARNPPSQHPLMPLTMMAKGQSANNAMNGHLSPQTESGSTRSLPNSSGSSSSNSLLSPVLFSPLSASSVSDSANSLNYKRKMMAPSEGSEVPNSSSTTTESAFSAANFHRMAAAAAAATSSRNNSPQQLSGGANNGTGSSTTSLQCPICSISLDGLDANAHFYEEMHKIDSLRKMAEWSSSNETSDSELGTNVSKRRGDLTSLGAKDGLTFDSLNHKASNMTHSSGSSSYQKKLQLPQSRWETFQRIRQNRHTRLAAFMRLTRRKYEAAYESSLHSPSNMGPHSNSNLSYPTHHSPSSTNTSSSFHRSPNSSGAAPTQTPHHASHQSFEPSSFLKGHTNDSKTSPQSATMAHSGSRLGPQSSETSGAMLSPATDAVSRSSPASIISQHQQQPPHPAYPTAAAAHSLFAQNPTTPFLPFYPSAAYHSAAVAAAAATSGVSSHLNPFSFPPTAYAFPGSEFFGTGQHHQTPSTPNGPQSNHRIWRSVDTDQLESEDFERTKKSEKTEDDVEYKRQVLGNDNVSRSGSPESQRQANMGDSSANNIDVVSNGTIQDQTNSGRLSRSSSSRSLASNSQADADESARQAHQCESSDEELMSKVINLKKLDSANYKSNDQPDTSELTKASNEEDGSGDESARMNDFGSDKGDERRSHEEDHRHEDDEGDVDVVSSDELILDRANKRLSYDSGLDKPHKRHCRSPNSFGESMGKSRNPYQHHSNSYSRSSSDLFSGGNSSPPPASKSNSHHYFGTSARPESTEASAN